MSEIQLTKLQQIHRDRFYSKIDKNGRINTDLMLYKHLSQCWTHNFSKSSSGYGQVCIKSRIWHIHRLSYVIHNGFPELESNQQILHACDNKDCATPEHLSIGTNSDNVIQCNERIKQIEAKVLQKNMYPCLSCKSNHNKCKGGYPCNYCKINGITDCIKADRMEHTGDLTTEQTSGENNVKAKLTEKIVRDLLTRTRTHGDVKKWASEFNIDRNSILNVLSGRTWKHIYLEINKPTPAPQ